MKIINESEKLLDDSRKGFKNIKKIKPFSY